MSSKAHSALELVLPATSANLGPAFDAAALAFRLYLKVRAQAARTFSIKAAGRAKAILTEASAQARANELLSKSITGTLVQYEMAKRWNGQMPQVTGSAMPMITLPKP